MNKNLVSLDGKNILVTGGAGFIGSHLCDELLKHACSKVVAVDNLYLGKERNIAQCMTDHRFVFEKADLTDFKVISGIIEDYSIDVVFHLAVIPLEASLDEPVWCFDQNVNMTNNLLEVIRKTRRGITLVSYSSSEVYGTAIHIPMNEEHPMLCHTPYAASKAASDLMVYSYIKTFGIDAVIVRPFNNFGPRQNEGNYAGVIPITIKRILNGEPPVIYDDGQQTRDFIYVKDTAKWTVEIYKNLNTRGEIINLSSGKQTTIEYIITEICRIMDYHGEILRKTARPGDVKCHQGDMSKAQRILQYNINFDSWSKLNETIEWYKTILI